MTDRHHPLLATLSAMVLTGAAGVGQDPPGQPAERPAAALPPVQPLGKAATEALVARYLASEHWLQKAVILLSMNHYWHPAGSTMILAAIQDRDKRLRAFGIEALLRAEADLLPTVASAELIDELVLKQLSASHQLYRSRVLAALARIAPDAKATGRNDWTRWWRATKATYEPKPWAPRPVADPADGGGTVAFAERAFDLYTAGLDLALCIDSTGSMQPSIDAVCEALAEMVDLLRGISPKLRLGIVHYKELGDFGSGNKTGAKVITPLSKNVPAARRKLLKIRAEGGGDLPERVTGGLAETFGRRMGWNPTANKAVIVIGDAPPHDAQAAREAAATARTDPDRLSTRPTTGKSGKPRPYITSTIGVLLRIDDPRIRVAPEFRSSQQRMQKEFRAIADAGGGVYAEIGFDVTVNKKGQLAPRDTGKSGAAGRKMVEHILVLSFGRRFVREMQAFVKIYYDYKTAGWFK